LVSGGARSGHGRASLPRGEPARGARLSALEALCFPGRGGLDEDVLLAEEDGAGAAAHLAHARAELRQLLVEVHDVAFDRLTGRLVVATVVEGDPHPRVLFRAAQLGPRHTSGHGISCAGSPEGAGAPRGVLEPKHFELSAKHQNESTRIPGRAKGDIAGTIRRVRQNIRRALGTSQANGVAELIHPASSGRLAYDATGARSSAQVGWLPTASPVKTAASERLCGPSGGRAPWAVRGRAPRGSVPKREAPFAPGHAATLATPGRLEDRRAAGAPSRSARIPRCADVSAHGALWR